MRKTVFALMLSVCFLLLASPEATASEIRGNVCVRIETGDTPVINGAVTLYQVGIRTEDGYRIAEGFGGGIVRQEDADSDKLAQWLAETAGEMGSTLLLDADGAAVFSDQEEGLYILVQTERIDGFYPIYPILLTIPEGEHWDVHIHREPVPVVTEIPQTGQSPVPFLGVLGMVLSSVGLIICVKKDRRQ